MTQISSMDLKQQDSQYDAIDLIINNILESIRQFQGKQFFLHFVCVYWVIKLDYLQKKSELNSELVKEVDSLQYKMIDFIKKYEFELEKYFIVLIFK